NPPVLIDIHSHRSTLLRTSSVGVGMLDEMPPVGKVKLNISGPAKIICYTDGLSELKDSNGTDLGASPIIKHFPNTLPVSENIAALIKDLDIHDSNPDLFDDVSILAVEIR
ncbi:MAG TPA: SpoIIE family protein phosphatase, partial [Bacteroidales bacterium]|nr:SpoIIE family protein phosphatase [Bacteroidales bacterium]